MARKKHPAPPPKPEEFRTTPFSNLRGVVVSPPAPPSPPETKKVPLTLPPDDGKELFLQAMTGVRKLDGPTIGGTRQEALPKPPQANQGKASPPPVDRASGELFLEEIKRLQLDVKFSDSLPADEELKPLPGNRLRQLKRGIITLDRQLDLHGLTRDEALQELPRFLSNARHKGCAAVLVITGKGLNSPAEPVLQQAVASWLRDTGRDLISEFTPAPRELGGSGAFVVFLRAATVPSPLTP